MKLIKIGRAFYAFSIIAMAVQQFFYPGFRPIFIPETPTWLPAPDFWIYLFSAYLIISGILIIVGQKAKTAALLLATVLFLLILFFHVPYQLTHYPAHLGSWTDALKCLAFSGGAFVAAGSLTQQEKGIKHGGIFFLEKLIPMGAVFFSITMISFGIDHFLYTKGVATLVPQWIPGDVFWTLFAAVALIASGLALILKIQTKWVGILLGIMILIWVFILHLPRAISAPAEGNGNEITSTLHALGFSGIAFMISGLLPKNLDEFKYRNVIKKKKHTPIT